MKNIKIMGAGLSGLSAAINLAKAGYNVDVFEKQSDCGKRFLGDLEGLENWSTKEDILHKFKSMNIKVNFNYNPFKKMYLSDGTEVLNNTSDRSIFYIVRRGAFENTLDQGLKNQAIDFGVNIHFNSKARIEDMDIISTGAAENRRVGVAKGILFETESDDIAVALINKEVSNSGYAYLLIAKGHGSMLSVNFFETDHNATLYFKKTYETLTKLFDIDIKNKKNVGGVGCFLLKPRLIENNKLFTGEAAGLQDYLWGFGMRYAIISGFYAASSIIEHKNYKKLIKKHLSSRIKRSVVNRYLSRKHGDQFYSHLMNLAKESNQWHNLLYQAYNPTWYSRMIYPFAKWSLSQKYKDIS